MLADQLENEWRERCASMKIEAVMRFSDEGLVLGAGTILARATELKRDIEIDIGDPRLLALLGAAHRREPTVSAVTYLRKAAECWRKGEDDMARMHLSLSGLARLEAPARDAQRLYLADRLLQNGVAASTIFKALDLRIPAVAALTKKYDPDQPRVPAGSGRTSGEWTTNGGGSSFATDQDAAELDSGKQRGERPNAPKTPAPGAHPVPDSAQLIEVSVHSPPTRDEIRAVLYNEFAALHLTKIYGGPDLIAAETQVGYVLMNRAANGTPPGHGTADAVIDPVAMQAIRDNPTGTEGRAYAIADMAAADMRPFGGDIQDITNGALYYNSRWDDGTGPNPIFGDAPVALQYGPFRSEGDAYPPFVDIYQHAPLRINPKPSRTTLPDAPRVPSVVTFQLSAV